MSGIPFQIQGHSNVSVINVSHQHSSRPVSLPFCVELGMKNDIGGSMAHRLIYHF